MAKKQLKLSDDDIIIPPLDLAEYNRGDMKDPVKYINKILNHYR